MVLTHHATDFRVLNVDLSFAAAGLVCNHWTATSAELVYEIDSA